jgi:glycosyltransferase involved in cell wall biosynthesis
VAKTNLLFVITKLELGGAQTQLLSLIRHLDTSQFNIFLFTAQSGFLMPDARGIPGLTVHASVHLERPIAPLADLLAFFELARFIKTHKIDIVHTHSSKAGILGRFAAAGAGVRKIFHTVHGWSFHPHQSRIAYMAYVLLERAAAAVTTRIIVVCQADKTRGLRAKIGGPGLYAVIAYAIDAQFFGGKDPRIRGRLGIPADALVVGTVACFKPQKAPLDYLALAREVAAKMPGVMFVMAGDGILRPKIERRIKKYGLSRNVILTGWSRDVAKLLTAFDVFVLTSYWEGLPISVMEAMASSLPVVATDTGGVAEIVRDQRNGFLCACGDVKALSGAVLRLLRDAGLRRAVGSAAAGSLAPEFTWQHAARCAQILYRE